MCAIYCTLEICLKCGYADTKYFQLRLINVYAFVRTQKRTKADENVYCVFQLLNNAKTLFLIR